MHLPPIEETKKVIEYLRSLKLKFTDISDSAYPNIVEKCKNYPLWVMSDVINYEAPVRKISYGIEIMFELFGSTGDFVTYLIDNKIGYVLASPIVQNPTHRSTTNYSLNRGWFWIPPAHLARAIDVAEAYGDDKFPSERDWAETVGYDLRYSKGNIKTEVVLKAVLNDGVFPKTEKRFRHRDRNGQFLPEPKISAA
jgi:hypothetical protein